MGSDRLTENGSCPWLYVPLDEAAAQGDLVLVTGGGGGDEVGVDRCRSAWDGLFLGLAEAGQVPASRPSDLPGSDGRESLSASRQNGSRQRRGRGWGWAAQQRGWAARQQGRALW